MQQESLLNVHPLAVPYPQAKLAPVDREPLTGPLAQGTAVPDTANRSHQVRMLALAETDRQWNTLAHPDKLCQSSAVPSLSLRSGSARSVFCSRQQLGVYKPPASRNGGLSYLRYCLS